MHRRNPPIGSGNKLTGFYIMGTYVICKMDKKTSGIYVTNLLTNRFVTYIPDVFCPF